MSYHFSLFFMLSFKVFNDINNVIILFFLLSFSRHDLIRGVLRACQNLVIESHKLRLD
jgi:hypothetical protein